MMRGGVEVQEAFDAALYAEGDRERSTRAIQPPQHRPEMMRRLLLRFLDECPEDLTVQELREALQP